MAIVKRKDKNGNDYYLDKNTGKRRSFMSYKISVAKTKKPIIIKKH